MPEYEKIPTLSPHPFNRGRKKRLPDPPRVKRTREEKLARKYKINPKMVIDALNEHGGLLAQTALHLGVSRGVLHRYVQENAECAKAAKEAREAMGDIAEQKLHELIRAGDPRMLMYYLSTVHRARGYGVRRGEDDLISANSAPQVNTINIIGVPSGTFLPAPQKTIEHDK
jgi:hypothetical protein